MSITLDIAQEVAKRSTCLRRKYGAVITNDDEIISTGYGGAPRLTANCNKLRFCYRSTLGARPGEHYEFCRAVHAEQNAIIQASRRDMLGGTLYLVCLDTKNEESAPNAEPCRLCKRQIVNAGIQLVVARQGRHVRKYAVREWVRKNLYELRRVKGRLVPEEPPHTLAEPVDEERRSRLIERFSLHDPRVVQWAALTMPNMPLPE